MRSVVNDGWDCYKLASLLVRALCYLLASRVRLVCREYKIRPVGGIEGVCVCKTSRSVKGGGGSSGAPEGNFDGNFAVKVQLGC